MEKGLGLIIFSKQSEMKTLELLLASAVKQSRAGTAARIYGRQMVNVTAVSSGLYVNRRVPDRKWMPSHHMRDRVRDLGTAGDGGFDR